MFFIGDPARHSSMASDNREGICQKNPSESKKKSFTKN